jgi:hypothetical protein
VPVPGLRTVFVSMSSMFWNMTPRSPAKVSLCFEERYRLYLQGRRVSQKQTSRQQPEEVCSFDTSVDFHWTTRCYIPEDRNLHSHCWKNLKFDILVVSVLLPAAVWYLTRTYSFRYRMRRERNHEWWLEIHLQGGGRDLFEDFITTFRVGIAPSV